MATYNPISFTNLRSTLNLVKNGDFSAFDSGYSASTSTNNGVVCPEWKLIAARGGSTTLNGVMRIELVNLTNAPFNYGVALKCVCLLNRSVLSSEHIEFQQTINYGASLFDFNYGSEDACPSFFSFWAYSSVAFSFTLDINIDNSRRFLKLFTISTINTWIKYSCYVPPLKTNSYGNTSSVIISFHLSLDSSRYASSTTDQDGTWRPYENISGTISNLGIPATYNFCTVLNNTVYFTGIEWKKMPDLALIGAVVYEDTNLGPATSGSTVTETLQIPKSSLLLRNISGYTHQFKSFRVSGGLIGTPVATIDSSTGIVTITNSDNNWSIGSNVWYTGLIGM